MYRGIYSTDIFFTWFTKYILIFGKILFQTQLTFKHVIFILKVCWRWCRWCCCWYWWDWCWYWWWFQQTPMIIIYYNSIIVVVDEHCVFNGLLLLMLMVVLLLNNDWCSFIFFYASTKNVIHHETASFPSCCLDTATVILHFWIYEIQRCW